MSASLEQLRAALVDDEGAIPPLAQADRMAGIRAHVAGQRRRRAGRYAAGVAALAVVAVLATTSVVGQRRAEPPAHRTVRPNPTVNGLPLFAHGGKQIGSAEVALKPGRTHLFTTTPASYGLNLAFGCTGTLGPDRPLGLTIQVNGQDTLQTQAGPCGDPSAGESVSGFGGYTPAAQQRYWASSGVQVGRPMSVDVVVPAGAQVSGLVRVAVYQKVPLADYPLPARPAHVDIDPDFGLSMTQTHEVTLPGGAADGSWSVTVPYDARLELGGFTTGPGQVEVRVGGRLVGGATSWAYSDNGFQVPIDPDALRLAGLAVPAAGAPTTITVTVSGFTDRTWRLRVGRSSRSQTSVG